MFGPHVNRTHARGSRPSITAHIKAARVAAVSVGFNPQTFQVFVAGPRKMSITLQDEEADELREYIAGEPGLYVVAHGTYLDYPWKPADYPIEFIHRELGLCARAGISGLVIHLGKPGVGEVMEKVQSLMANLGENPALIYLETPHVKPRNSHYETPEKLAALFREIRAVDVNLDRFALCVDTAHLWSCGVDLQSFEAADAWLHRLEAVADVIPPNRILFHLNDSLDALGSGVDHHAALLTGQIWRDYADRPMQSGLAAFAQYAARHRIRTILERKPDGALLDDYAALNRIGVAERR